VKVEVDEAEITVEEHGINLDSSDDNQWLVGTPYFGISLQYSDLLIRTTFIYWAPQSRYHSLHPFLFSEGG
jgi:hypothetical protein